jgi:hypothetical protein
VGNCCFRFSGRRASRLKKKMYTKKKFGQQALSEQAKSNKEG